MNAQMTSLETIDLLADLSLILIQIHQRSRVDLEDCSNIETLVNCLEREGLIRPHQYIEIVKLLNSDSTKCNTNLIHKRTEQLIQDLKNNLS
jgi:hypothetical protein